MEFLELVNTHLSDLGVSIRSFKLKSRLVCLWIDSKRHAKRLIVSGGR